MNKKQDNRDGPAARPIKLEPCPKGFSHDQDKAVPPEETLAAVKKRLSALPFSILAETRRIDNGTLDIPVFLSVCGEDARRHMPTRKQMGKGASPEQAEASALMELMERFGFFTFWEELAGAPRHTWTEAQALYGPDLMPVEEVIKACHDSISPDDARRVLDLRSWLFYPALRIADGATVYAPLDLFKQLGEFNGSSAGNTDVESILQGACELAERHACCLADLGKPALPTIDLSPESLRDTVLIELLGKFYAQGITVVLKDFSLSLPVPVVAALAWDPASFPETSEIVFTAGSASSPAKAAVRALTEVAQLAGDFNSKACYEASGLPKFSSLAQSAWLLQGERRGLDTLPSIEADDILTELRDLAAALHAQNYSLYAVSTASRITGVPSHYSFVPGFRFRERDANASLGLFTGRLISEEADPTAAERAFSLLHDIYPDAHFVSFFRGMLALREGDLASARVFFELAEPGQPDNDSKALAAFYLGYTWTAAENWREALPHLDRAACLCPDMKEYLNLRGVCFFKLGEYEKAAEDFAEIVKRLDKGSAVDLQNLGICRKRLGDTEVARQYLEAALSVDPSLARARQELEEIG